MPNWCYNCEKIVGPKKEIMLLFDNLEKWTSKNFCDNGFGTGWLGNIVGFAGLKRSDEDAENGYRCRGSVIDGFDIEDEDDDDACISYTTETAWGPMPDMWYALLEKYAPHCNYYYSSEEPGMGVYYSNDVKHRFFDEEFFVDVCIYNKDKIPQMYIEEFGEEPSWERKEDSIRKSLQRILATNEEDIDKLLEMFEDKALEDLDDNAFISINKIEYDDNDRD